MNHIVNNHSAKQFHSATLINDNSSVFREGEMLFRMGDQLDGVYQLNSGAIKLYSITESGEEHIIRFCMPGDLIGLDALTDSISKSNAQVLDIANVTLFSHEAIMNGEGFELSVFMKKVAQTLHKETEHSMMLSHCTASRRLAWFLVEFSDKLASRGMVANEFLVPMIRADIAMYLGLALETVSRELSRFCKQGLIKKKLRHFEIVDLDAMRAISRASEALH